MHRLLALHCIVGVSVMYVHEGLCVFLEVEGLCVCVSVCAHVCSRMRMDVCDVVECSKNFSVVSTYHGNK